LARTLPVSYPKMGHVVIDYLEITFVSLPSQIYAARSRTGARRNPCQAVFSDVPAD